MAVTSVTRRSLAVLGARPQLLAALQQRAGVHSSSEIPSSGLLYYEEVQAAGRDAAAPPKTVCVLHGLLGTGR